MLKAVSSATQALLVDDLASSQEHVRSTEWFGAFPTAGTTAAAVAFYQVRIRPVVVLFVRAPRSERRRFSMHRITRRRECSVLALLATQGAPADLSCQFDPRAPLQVTNNRR